jgi:hypothetical protein
MIIRGVMPPQHFNGVSRAITTGQHLSNPNLPGPWQASPEED